MIVDKQKQTLTQLQEKIDIINRCIDKNVVEAALEKLKEQQEAPAFWQDLSNAQKVNKQMKHLSKKHWNCSTKTGDISSSAGFPSMF